MGLLDSGQRARQRTRRKLAAAAALLAYAVLALVFIVFQYQRDRAHALAAIDRDLQTAATLAAELIPPEVHDQAMVEAPLSLDQEQMLASQLTGVVQQLGLSYLYTMIRPADDAVRFVISTAPPNDQADASFEMGYLGSYTEDNMPLSRLFNTDARVFREYSDRRGEFRSVFSPARTPAGTSYLISAGASLSLVESRLVASARDTAVFALILLLVSLPLLILAASNWRRQWRRDIHRLRFDPLTGARSLHQLQLDIEQAELPRLLVMRLLHFDRVNDTFGPAAGDQVLKLFARHLAAVRITGFDPHRTYRIYGDEFGLLVDQPDLPADLDQSFSEFVHQIASFSVNLTEDDALRLHVTTGVALEGNEDLFTRATIALKAAEETNRSIVVYDPSLLQANPYRYDLKQLALLRKHAVTPYFQPIFDATTLEVRRYEALARLVDDQGQLIDERPASMIAVAQRYQLYYRVTRAMITRGLAWADNNGAAVSFNISIADIEHRPTVEMVLREVADCGFGDRISFELLETEAVSDIRRVRRFFHSLKALGCRVGIDDLGKDYSNFDRFAALEIDFVKLDGVVLRQLERTPEAFRIVRDVVKLAHRRNIRVTAEYICRPALLDLARRLGCDLVQGFYLAAPSPQPIAPDHLSEAS